MHPPLFTRLGRAGLAFLRDWVRNRTHDALRTTLAKHDGVVMLFDYDLKQFPPPHQLGAAPTTPPLPPEP